MKITTEPLENRQLRLTIELDEEQTQQAMQRAARKIARQVNIPGFRKGKAPYKLIVQRYGENAVRQEAADDMVEKVYREALEQEDIQPYAPAALEDIALDPVTFEFTIPLHPKVDLGDYRDYRLKPRKVRIYKKEVQQTLQEIREQNAILELAERPVALGDGAVIDAVGWVDDVEFMNLDQVRLLLDAETTDPAPGFSEALVGMEAGDERTFTLTLPDDFPQEELQGQEAEFTVKMAEVYDSTLPDLDDDLARTVGNFDSLKELEKSVKEQLRQKAQQEADAEYTEQVVDAIVEQAQIEYPPLVLEETLDDIIKDFEQTVKRQTQLALDDYLRISGKSEEDLREEFEPTAQSHLRHSLALSEVIVLERIEIDKEEIEAYIEEVSAAWGDRAKAMRSSLSTGEGRKTVVNRLLGAKAVERLVAIAKGEAPQPGTVEEQSEEAEERENKGERE
ncbi:MAG TPA: trigger factor [Thermoflexia bacterium]|nr:trigger factor [Thermoflexia bacterium]